MDSSCTTSRPRPLVASAGDNADTADSLVAQKAVLYEEPVNASGDTLGDYPTEVRLSYDREYLYLAVRWRLERKEGSFNLGRFELPVGIAALVWVLVALFVPVVPAEAVVPDLIVVGLILGGGLFFLVMLIFNRKALEAEPGNVDVFTH